MRERGRWLCARRIGEARGIGAIGQIILVGVVVDPIGTLPRLACGTLSDLAARIFLGTSGMRKFRGWIKILTASLYYQLATSLPVLIFKFTF